MHRSLNVSALLLILTSHLLPMRWAMDSVVFLTLASTVMNVKASTFRILACIEMTWVYFGVRQVHVSNRAELGVVAEVFWGLLLVVLCTYSHLRTNEIMAKTIYYRERTDRIVNHRKCVVLHSCKGAIFR